MGRFFFLVLVACIALPAHIRSEVLSCEECSRNLSTFCDLLVWSAQESGSENWGQVFTTDGLSETIDVLDADFGWNGGVRVGGGYTFNCNLWDTQLYYTRFCTRAENQASTNATIASSFLGNFYIHNQSGQGNGPGYKEASLQWKLFFNVIDWELGYHYFIGRMLSVRPFLGLKAGWIHQKIDSQWQHPNVAGFTFGTENLKNNFWGIGPKMGVNTKWEFLTLQRGSLSLFGDYSAALLRGHWRFSDIYENDAPEGVDVNSRSVSGAATAITGIMGLGWESDFCQKNAHFTLRVGYEMQFWLNQLQFYTFNMGRLNNELTLQGSVIDVRFDF